MHIYAAVDSDQANFFTYLRYIIYIYATFMTIQVVSGSVLASNNQFSIEFPGYRLYILGSLNHAHA